MSSLLNKNETESAIRREATRRGETVLAFGWNGEDPTLTLDQRDRTREEMTQVGQYILRDALAPLLQKAAAKAVADAFKKGFR